MGHPTVRELHRYDVNLSLLFTEFELLERPAAAAAAGFDAVELWWPFSTPTPRDHQVNDLLATLRDAGTSLVGLNLFSGDMGAGEKGIISHPGRQDELRANLPVVARIVEETGCQVLNGLFGNRVDGLALQDQMDVGVEGLALAARELAPTGASIVLEAMNAFGAPDYPLHSTRSAATVADRATATAGVEVKLLYDVFHMQQAEGNLIETVKASVDRIGHVQIADVPGRGQPGTGEIAYPRFLHALRDTGYGGYVGLEYAPTGASQQSFAWLDEPLDTTWIGART